MKIVIIGAGIAGLSAGIYALENGFEVEIYEKNKIPGGQCMGWRRKGFYIDNCIHYLVGARRDTEIYKIWKKIGALTDETPYIETEYLYASTANGQTAYAFKDLEREEKHLIELSKEDEVEIKKFIQAVKWAQSCTIPVKMPMDMMGIKDYMNLGMSMADMVKVIKEYGKESAYEMSKRFKNAAIQKMITDYIPEESVATNFVVSYATYTCGNGEIPQGGSLAFSQRIKNRFLELGGKLNIESEVEQINVEKNEIKNIIVKGKEVNADYYISAIDAHYLFNNLVDPKYMDKKMYNNYNDNKFFTFSGLQMAYKVKIDQIKMPGTVFFDCSEEIGNKTIKRLYTKTYEYEPSFGDNEYTVVQVNITQDKEDAKFWNELSEEAYNRKKEEALETVRKILIRQCKFTDIEALDCWTPKTYTRYCNSYNGAYMAFMTKPNTKNAMISNKVKGIKNLFLATQWQYAPGGLPTAAAMGKFAVQRILKSEKKNWKNI